MPPPLGYVTERRFARSLWHIRYLNCSCSVITAERRVLIDVCWCIAISAAERQSSETLNTIKLVSKARRVINKPVVTEVNQTSLRYVQAQPLDSMHWFYTGTTLNSYEASMPNRVIPSRMCGQFDELSASLTARRRVFVIFALLFIVRWQINVIDWLISTPQPARCLH